MQEIDSRNVGNRRVSTWIKTAPLEWEAHDDRTQVTTRIDNNKDLTVILQYSSEENGERKTMGIQPGQTVTIKPGAWHSIVDLVIGGEHAVFMVVYLYND